MPINSKVDVCNLAISHLGSIGSVNNIDVPSSTVESTFALWYDIARQNLIKMSMPNFAMARRVVGQLSAVPVFGWGYAFEYPKDCLKLLGIGEVEEKKNNYSVEGNVIYTDCPYTNGMPIRFLLDVKDVNSMSVEFKVLLSWYLAAAVCMPITQSLEKKKALEALLPSKMSEASGLNAQENRPIRISNSRFKEARFNKYPNFNNKK